MKEKRERKAQVNIVVDGDMDDLLNSAVRDLGLTRSTIASEVFDIAFPIYLEIKRQEKADVSARLRAALEVALGKPATETPMAPPMAESPPRRKGGRGG